jgi:hypothetical protein
MARASLEFVFSRSRVRMRSNDIAGVLGLLLFGGQRYGFIGVAPFVGIASFVGYLQLLNAEKDLVPPFTGTDSSTFPPSPPANK